jgi:hypothetical protein
MGLTDFVSVGLMGYLLQPRYPLLSTFKDEKDGERDTAESKGVSEKAAEADRN